MLNFLRLNVLAILTVSLAATAQAEQHQKAENGSLCEDGYSATDVDGNGYISQIEMNAYAERSATDMDTDKSGTVSRDEYVNCNNSMSGTKAASTQRTEEDMAALDENEDGSLTLDEFMTGSAELQQKASGGDDAASSAMGPRTARMRGRCMHPAGHRSRRARHRGGSGYWRCCRGRFR